METILKINKKNPFIIDLPNNQKIELFLEKYEIHDTDKIAKPYHIFQAYYNHEDRLNFLTDKIIDFYIKKGFSSYTKLFSIDGNIIIKTKKK